MRDAFRSWGHEADVYALELDADLVGDGRPFSEWQPERHEGRRRHPPLRAALASHRRTSRAPRPARSPPPQHHAPRVLRGLGRGDGPDLRPRARASSRSLAAHVDLGPRRQRVEPPGARGAGLPRARGCCPSTSTSAATARPRTRCCGGCSTTAARTSSSWAASPPTSATTTSIRLASYWKRFISPDVRLLLVGKLPRRGGATSTRCRPSSTRTASRPGRWSSPATWTTTTSWPATPPPTSSSP